MPARHGDASNTMRPHGQKATCTCTLATLPTNSSPRPAPSSHICGQKSLRHGSTQPSGTGEKIMKISDIKLPGIHNLQNSLVAIAISKIMGADNDDIAAVLSTFTGAKHRLQYVTTLDGCKVYNDSKSTNIEAATVAIPSFKQPEVLILLQKKNLRSSIKLQLFRQRLGLLCRAGPRKRRTSNPGSAACCSPLVLWPLEDRSPA